MSIQLRFSAVTLALLSSVCAPLALGQTSQLSSATPLTLGQVLAAARGNVDVSLARSAAEAAQADILSADHAPLPTLSAKLSSIDLENGIGQGSVLGERRIDKGIGIDWTWERGNKRELRTLAAQRNAKAAMADVEETQMQQLLAASSAFFDLSAAQERVTLVEQIANGTAQIASTAARRAKAGDLARQDALRLEIEAERAKGDVMAATLDRQRAALALAALLGVSNSAQPLYTQYGWHTAYDKPAYADLSESVLEPLVDARADIRAAKDRAAAADAALQGASAQNKADITWGVSLDHFPGTSSSLLELRLQMPLQFGYQFQGETGHAQAQLAAARSALEKIRRAAVLELQGLRAQLLITTQRDQNYQQDILPRASQVAAQAELAYTKGALALSDLIDARRTLRATGLEALAAQADHAKAVTAWRLRTQSLATLLTE